LGRGRGGASPPLGIGGLEDWGIGGLERNGREPLHALRHKASADSTPIIPFNAE